MLWQWAGVQEASELTRRLNAGYHVRELAHPITPKGHCSRQKRIFALLPFGVRLELRGELEKTPFRRHTQLLAAPEKGATDVTRSMRRRCGEGGPALLHRQQRFRVRCSPGKREAGPCIEHVCNVQRALQQRNQLR